MRFSSIRIRLALWNVGILAIALLITLTAVNVAVRSYMLGSIDQRLQRTTERFQEFLNRPPPDPPRGFTPPPRRESEQTDRIRNARMPRIFDLQGRLLGRDGKPATEQEHPWDMTAYRLAVVGKASFTTIKGEDAPIRIYSRPFTRNGQPAGVIQMAFSLHEMQVVQDGLTTILLVLVPCVLLLAGLGGLFLTDRALRPVRGITHAADALNADDLSQRLPVAGTDEFGHLAETMNRMLSRLEQAFGQLKESIERERRFTADASHELRTPLTAIKANSSLALRGERTPAQYRESLLAINTAAGNMHHLVHDLLLLARSDSGQLTLECQAVDPHTLLQKAVSDMPVHEGQPTPSVEVAAGTPAIWGDPHHLQRLLHNLLENALQHTPEAGSVIVSAHSADGHIILAVTDTGEGVAPEHLPHLGERFYRIDLARAREHGGTGLGLAICRSIVEAHRGTMDIESILGQGTRVTVTLPAATV